MTTADILALARAALDDDQRATPGPWAPSNRSSDPTASYDVWKRAAFPESTGRIARVMALGDRGLRDAHLIAAARTREPALARWIERVAPAIERLREASDGLGLEGASTCVFKAIDALLAAAETP